MARRRRNAVLAPMTRWLWWTPWRMFGSLAATVAVLALLLTGLRDSHARHAAPRPSLPVSTVSGDAAADPSPAATVTAPDTATASGPTSPMPTHATAHPTLPPAARDRARAVRAGVAWVALWARPHVPEPRWLAALRPRTFPDYLNTLSSVSPVNVPAARVGGTATMLTFAPAAAAVRVPTGGGSVKAVRVEVIFWPTSSSGGWLVTNVAPTS